jgi:hypothetical protein
LVDPYITASLKPLNHIASRLDSGAVHRTNEHDSVVGGRNKLSLSQLHLPFNEPIFYLVFGRRYRAPLRHSRYTRPDVSFVGDVCGYRLRVRCEPCECVRLVDNLAIERNCFQGCEDVIFWDCPSQVHSGFVNGFPHDYCVSRASWLNSQLCCKRKHRLKTRTNPSNRNLTVKNFLIK